MQQPTIGDKFQFEENTTEYVITDVVKYHEDGKFSNKLYQDGYQIKYINPNTLSLEMKCGIKYDEELDSFINYYAVRKGVSKRLVIFTHKS